MTQCHSICGVYRITCVPTGRVYVGSSVDIKRRWKKHRSDLNACRHRNMFLTRAWHKHGSKAFKFEVLEETTQIDLLSAELRWIRNLGAFAPAGFNSASPGKADEAAREYIITDLRGRERHIRNLFKWCRERGVPAWTSNLTLVAQGRKPAHHGWRCRYAHESRSSWEDKIARLLAHRRRTATNNMDGYAITAPDGASSVIAYGGLTPWCAKRGLSPSAMVRVAKGEARHHHGYVVVKAKVA